MCTKDYMWPAKPKILTVWPFIEKSLPTLSPAENEQTTTRSNTMNGFTTNRLSKRGYIHKETHTKSNWDLKRQVSGCTGPEQWLEERETYVMLSKSCLLHRCILFVGNLTSCTLICVSIYYLNRCIWQMIGKCNLNYWSPLLSLRSFKNLERFLWYPENWGETFHLWALMVTSDVLIF